MYKDLSSCLISISTVEIKLTHCLIKLYVDSFEFYLCQKLFQRKVGYERNIKALDLNDDYFLLSRMELCDRIAKHVFRCSDDRHLLYSCIDDYLFA